MFMLKKSLPEPEPNGYDRTYKRMMDDVCSLHWDLRRQVSRVMIRQGVVSLYPDGADKTAAELRLTTAKGELLNYIAAYDLATKELAEYKAMHAMDFRITHHERISPYLTSHQIVEQAYEDFIKRK